MKCRSIVCVIVRSMTENKDRGIIVRFEKEISSPGFETNLREILTEYGIEQSDNKWVEIDEKKGFPRLVVDISPKGLGDTDLVKQIIDKIKPEVIFYKMGRADDAGETGYLTIPTRDKRICLRASVYIFDVGGGIWKNFNDVGSSGYRDIREIDTPYYGSTGRFELVR